MLQYSRKTNIVLVIQNYVQKVFFIFFIFDANVLFLIEINVYEIACFRHPNGEVYKNLNYM